MSDLPTTPSLPPAPPSAAATRADELRQRMAEIQAEVSPDNPPDSLELLRAARRRRIWGDER